MRYQGCIRLNIDTKSIAGSNFSFVRSYLRSIEGDLNDRNKPPKTNLLRLS